MTRAFQVAFAVSLAFVSLSAQRSTPPASASAATAEKAAVVVEIKTDQRDFVTPPAGWKFLWVTTKLAGPVQTIDLTKVSVASGTNTYPLVGVDSAFGGDPSQFSMIVPARVKGAQVRDPLEETRSNGDVAFAFTPGKLATLKVINPPQSICLAFAVPAAFRSGTIKGLGGKDVALPTLTAEKP